MEVIGFGIQDNTCISLKFEDGQTKVIEIGAEGDDPELVANQIMFEYPNIPDCMRSKLISTVITIKENLKIKSEKVGKYYLTKKLNPHIHLLANFVINNKGDILTTCSYDNTAIITSIETSEVINKLEGHSSVVYCIAINKPYENKLATGSFDSTARIWEFPSGKLLHILEGHKLEITSIDFSPSGELLATCEMNKACIIWSVESGEMIHKLVSHSAEVTLVYNIHYDHNYNYILVVFN